MSEKKLQDLLDKLDKTYGKGTIMCLGDKPEHKYEVISTGSFQLDQALGIGGMPRGRIIEIYGPESSGKTTLTLHAIAEAQKKGLRAAFIDVEHAFDATYAQQIGVDVKTLYLSQPDNAEQALEIVDALVNSEEFGIVILDSIAALVTKKELEGEMGDAHMGLLARLMGQAMRKLVPSVSKTNTLLILINQIRAAIGGMGYGPTTDTPGGKAVRFAASGRMEIKRIGSDKTGDEITANKTKVKVTKCKFAPPFKEVEFNIEFGVGIDKVGEILDIAVDNNIVKKAGSWFSYGDTKLGQGAVGVKTLLLDNPELFEEIEGKVKALFNAA